MGNSSIIMYTNEDGLTKIETTFDEDTVWLSLEQMAELFQRDKSYYLKAYQKHIWRRWITKKFSCCKFCNNCLWRKNISGRLHAVFSSRSSFCFISACLSLSWHLPVDCRSFYNSSEFVFNKNSYTFIIKIPWSL